MVTLPSTMPSEAPARRDSDTCLSPMTLQIIGGEYDGQTISLASPKILVGSSRRATLRLVGCGAAPHELQIIRGSHGTVVRNNSPRNLLNGQAFSDTFLHPGDKLSVGAIQFKCLDSDDVAPGDTTASPEARAEKEYPVTQSLDSVHEDIASELTLAQQELDQLRAELQAHDEEARNDLLQWQREREQWIDELAESRELALQAKSELEALHAEYDANCDTLRQQVDEWKAKFEETESGEPEISTELQQRIDELALQNEEAVTQQIQAEEQLAEAKSRIGELEEKCAAFRTATEAAAEAISSAEDRILELESELAESRDESSEATPADAAASDEERLAYEERLQELEARELALAEKASELEAASAELQSMQQALEAERESLAAAAEESAPPQSVGEDHEKALAELLQLRQELDRHSEDMERREANLAAREQRLSNNEFESQESADADPQNEPESVSSHTIMLDDQESSAMTIAQRFLTDAEGESEEGDEVEDVILNHDHNEADAENESAGDEFFTEPDKGAPVSATEILAKYANLDADDEVEAAVESPAIAETISVENPSGSFETSDDADQEEDSIRDYMDQLMRRVRGETQRMPESPAPAAVEAKKVAAPVVEEPEPPAAKPKKDPAFEVMNSAEFTPRSSAPEESDRLAKMREVANATANTAINTATRKRRAQAAAIHVAMAIGAVVAGGMLIAYQTAGMPLVRYLTATGAFGMSGLWTYRAVTFSRGTNRAPAQSFLSRLLRRKQK